MNKDDFKVWECKIVVRKDAKLPKQFDEPPRIAAINAVKNGGVEVVGCSSCWGGELTQKEYEEMISQDEVYFAGLIDAEPVNKMPV